MSEIVSLIIPLLSSGYFWGGLIAALGILACWIYLNGRASGKAAERQKALKQEIKDKTNYETGYKKGASMPKLERANWVCRFLGKQ